MNSTSVRWQSLVAVCLALLVAAPIASAATEASSWEAPPEGAAEMFRQGDRLFAVGAQNGGAGLGVVLDGEEDLPPGPSGEVFEDSRCAMTSGSCDGTCISHLNYYCSRSTCDKFNFCP